MSEASSQPVIISHGQLGHAGTAHPRLLTTEHVTAVASAGGLIGAWPAGLTSQSLADFADEIIRLTQVAGPGHAAIGTDLDGNYRPVLTSYAQFDDLAGLLRGRGLPQDRIRQLLGGNIQDLLCRIIPWNGRPPAAAAAPCTGLALAAKDSRSTMSAVIRGESASACEASRTIA